MSDPFEQKYHRFNTILSVVIGGMLAGIGGLWLYQNKDFKFTSPVKWVVDQALKNDAGLPKSEPMKGIHIDPEAFQKSINAGVLNADQIRGLEKDFGKFNRGIGNFQPPQINVPSYQPPRPYIPPTGPRH